MEQAETVPGKRGVAEVAESGLVEQVQRLSLAYKEVEQAETIVSGKGNVAEAAEKGQWTF